MRFFRTCARAFSLSRALSCIPSRPQEGGVVRKDRDSGGNAKSGWHHPSHCQNIGHRTCQPARELSVADLIRGQRPSGGRQTLSYLIHSWRLASVASYGFPRIKPETIQGVVNASMTLPTAGRPDWHLTIATGSSFPTYFPAMKLRRFVEDTATTRQSPFS